MSRLGRALLALALVLALRPFTVLPLQSVWLSVLLQELLCWGLPAALLGGWRRQAHAPARVLAAAAPAGMLLQLPLAALTRWWQHLIGSSGTPVPFPASAPEWLLAVLALAVVPSLAEEAFFRGCLQPAMDEKLGAGSVWITALLFAGVHGSPGGLPAHLCVGLACGWCARCSGSVLPGMLLHMGYNGMVLLLPSLQPGAVWPLAALGGAGAAAYLLLLPRKKVPAPKGADALEWLLTVVCAALAAAGYLR